MRKELGKWFTDIAKYMTTAILLSSVFDGLEKPLTLAIGITTTVITLTAGMLLICQNKK